MKLLVLLLLLLRMSEQAICCQVSSRAGKTIQPSCISLKAASNKHHFHESC